MKPALRTVRVTDKNGLLPDNDREAGLGDSVESSGCFLSENSLPRRAVEFLHILGRIDRLAVARSAAECVREDRKLLGLAVPMLFKFPFLMFCGWWERSWLKTMNAENTTIRLFRFSDHF
jgi:hypothetical protein